MNVMEIMSKDLASMVELSKANLKVLVNVYNVQGYGAKGNGISDDTIYIQAAIDACAAAGGGVVYLPPGIYAVSAALVKKAKVSIKGAGMFVTTLKFTATAGGNIIDTSNQDLRGTSIEDLQFIKAANVTGNVTGISGGSTLTNYNSAIGVFRNLYFSYIRYGIRGNAEPTGVGIFDSYFENIWCDNCFFGIWTHGSGNIIVHPRLTLNNTGLVLDYLNTNSYSGVHMLGGIFIQNTYDVGVPNVGGLRPCTFEGTWFEQATQGIMNIANANTPVMSFKMEGCMLSASSTGNMCSFANALGAVTLDACTIVQTASTYKKDIAAPTNANSKLIIRNTWGINFDNTTFVMDTQQRGSATVNNAAQNGWTSLAVTFSNPFPVGMTPIVILTAVTGNRVHATASNKSNTGFTINIYNLDAVANIAVDYIATQP